MTRIKITELEPGDDVTSGKVNETFDSWATASASIDTVNIREEAFDRRSLSNNAVVPAIYWYADGSDHSNGVPYGAYHTMPYFQVPATSASSSGIDLTIDNFNCAIIRASFEYKVFADTGTQPVLGAIIGYATDGPSSTSWTTINSTERWAGFHESIQTAASIPSTTADSFELHPDGVNLRGTMTITHRFTSSDSSTYAFGVFTGVLTGGYVGHVIRHPTITVEVFRR
tara:strand:- start:424 stop:1107 length:684 start_codon:yes stop_codon:yes gene_type:complete